MTDYGTQHTAGSNGLLRRKLRITLQGMLLLLALLPYSDMHAAPPSVIGILPPEKESRIGFQGIVGSSGYGSGIALDYSYSFSSLVATSVQASFTDSETENYLRGDITLSFARTGNSVVSTYGGISTQGTDTPCFHTGLGTHIFTGIPLFLVGAITYDIPTGNPGDGMTSWNIGAEIPVTVNMGLSFLSQQAISDNAYSHYAIGLVIFY
ncbi:MULTISPECIES: hypothetical protein [Prosthecochloris]|uniref:Uncharacterized protein n=1 Tax=Prosthecochloris vibrioformis TaxID=1098 RepID=A0A5C4S1E8_PROVB|nr:MULTISPECIES: hypothetical protein [Prosthecochloris]ANT64993.1 hypothetical protein Ptc2401_01220 [Prosthecochloris sp. CIB 2401]TNJ36937.1 hypothetical protein FGF68_05020 [Prosthecochloris vibrioformis]